MRASVNAEWLEISALAFSVAGARWPCLMKWQAGIGKVDRCPTRMRRARLRIKPADTYSALKSISVFTPRILVVEEQCAAQRARSGLES